MLNEIIPCGIDPVGVFILETREERERSGGEKNLREIHRPPLQSGTDLG